MTKQKVKIDKRVRLLVHALNSIPGVDTFSSCGGHQNPKKGQVAADEFNVNFDVDKSATGWRALEIIAEACMRPDFLLHAWSDSPGVLCFELAGKNHADPDELAILIFQKEFQNDERKENNRAVRLGRISKRTARSSRKNLLAGMREVAEARNERLARQFETEGKHEAAQSIRAVFKKGVHKK